MTCVTVFMKQVISGNYSYLQLPPLPPSPPAPQPLCAPITAVWGISSVSVRQRQARRQREAERKNNPKQLWHEASKIKFDETIVLFLFFPLSQTTTDCQPEYLLTSDLKRICPLPLPISPRTPPTLTVCTDELLQGLCRSLWEKKKQNFDEICYISG